MLQPVPGLFWSQLNLSVGYGIKVERTLILSRKGVMKAELYMYHYPVRLHVTMTTALTQDIFNI